MVGRLIAALVIVTAACGDDSSVVATSAATIATATAVARPDSPSGPVDAFGDPIPPAPPVLAGSLASDVAADLDRVFEDPEAGIDLAALDRLGFSGDARIAWLLADLLRFSIPRRWCGHRWRLHDLGDEPLLGFDPATSLGDRQKGGV